MKAHWFNVNGDIGFILRARASIIWSPGTKNTCIKISIIHFIRFFIHYLLQILCCLLLFGFVVVAVETRFSFGHEEWMTLSDFYLLSFLFLIFFPFPSFLFLCRKDNASSKLNFLLTVHYFVCANNLQIWELSHKKIT